MMMKVPYSWLKTYIELNYRAEELAEVLTMAGMEVDEIEYRGQGLEGIVVGQVSEIAKHPNADQLQICQVDLGPESIQIVSGAPNIEQGALVPVATVGVTLPNGMEIKPVKLRGELSCGMLCSVDELGFSQERAAGIMILEDGAAVGMKLIEYLELDDYILNMDLTPNYARCLGLLGLARELKAIQGKGKINWPVLELKETEQDISELIQVEVEDVELCPRYTGRIIQGVKIGPAPDWMQKRLAAAGIRPINNVVDITNYVLMEYNQPLHAFDYHKIADQKIIVRRAEQGEKLLTLDQQERELDQEILVIADQNGAVGLAGVMGGANSEVDEDTVDLFLEAAYFNPVNIRKTARKLGLPSEASHRFERGVDIEMVIEASNRAAYLIQQYAGGRVVKGLIDLYPQPFRPRQINLESELVNRLLGLQLTAEQIAGMLERLEFRVENEGKGVLVVTVPSYRNDVSREADLIEEVARLYGYNNIPLTRTESKQQGGKTFKQNMEDLSRELMLSSGLDEIINFSLTATEHYNRLRIPADSQLRDWVRIKNPLNESFAVLRTSLIPGIIEVLANNAKRQVGEMEVFELGNVYFAGSGEPEERLMLGGGSMGYHRDQWNTGAADFFFLKGILESYFLQLGLNTICYEPALVSYLHPGRTARINSAGREVGIIGELLPELIAELDLKKRATVFQLDFARLLEDVKLERHYQPLLRYPAVERDLAVMVKKEVNCAELLERIRKEGGELLKAVRLFDLYQGDQILPGAKSLAFKLVFQATDRTLRDQEVNQVFNRIVTDLEKRVGAKIRGN